MPTLEEMYQQALSEQPPVLPTLPRGTPDDGTRPGLLGRIGEVLAGGQSPTYRLGGREADAAGNRALLNFGLNMLQASGPARVRPDLLTAAATGLQGAQQSMDLDQRRAAAVAQQDYTQRMDLAKLGVEQNRDRIERLKAMLPLLQLQNRPVINADGSVSTAGTGGGGAGGGATRQFTGDLEKDRQLIKGWESGGDPTALNYVAKADPSARARGATASGLYGFVDSTWQEGLKMIGGDPSKYPTAASAPTAVQDDVFTAVYKARGTAPWDPSKWGQNWVRNAAGGYDLVKTGTGGTPSTPPPYKVATTGTTPPPPTATAPAPDATQPPAATTTQPSPPAATPAPPTTGPLAGLPTFDDFSKQNMAKPTPDEEALWRTPLAPEEEKNLRDGLKRLQSSVDAARASFNAGGSKDTESAYHTAQKAYVDQEELLSKRQSEALKVGDDRKAKWLEGERGRLKDLYGELVKGNIQIQTADNAAANTRKTKALEGLDGDVKAAGDRMASFDVLRTLSRQVDGSQPIADIKFNGEPLVDILAKFRWGSPETLRNYGVIQAYRAAANLAVKEVREGMSMGSMSDRDLSFIENMIPRLAQDTFTRELGVSLLEAAQRRKRDIGLKAADLIAGGETPTKAFQLAQDQAPKIIADVPNHVKAMSSDQRAQWFHENVRAGQAFRRPDGKIDIYFGDEPPPPGWTNLSDLKVGK
jgi:hypothetical protein